MQLKVWVKNNIHRVKNHYLCCHDSVGQERMFTLVSKSGGLGRAKIEEGFSFCH